MKYLVIGALLGALSFTEVQAIVKRGPASNAAEQAAAVAAKSGADPSPDDVAKQAIKDEKEQEMMEDLDN